VNSASTTNPGHVVVPSRSALVVVTSGYAVEAIGLIALLTINGMSSVPPLALIATIILIVAGFLLPTGGFLALRTGFDRTHPSVRSSLLLQGSGLVVLLLGVVVAVGLNSLSGFMIGTVFLVPSAASALMGAILLLKNYASIGWLNPREAIYLVLGTALIFSGVGVIMASNIVFFYLISGIANEIYTDAGATISAIGCVVAAYSFFEVHRH